MNFANMLSKELKELARSYKLLFVPALFALLGVGQPVSFVLMPTVLKNASNLPPGTILEIPTPPPGEIVASALGQFNQVGILVLVLIAMGAIAGERASGVAATVLTKPVGRGEYLAAKATAFGLLAAISMLLSVAATAYYTQVLIAPVNWADAMVGAVLYLPNLLMAVAATLLFSAFMPSPVSAGGTALVTVLVLNVLPRYLGKFLTSISPGRLTESAMGAIAGKEYLVLRPVLGVLTLTLLLLLAGWQVLRRQEI